MSDTNHPASGHDNPGDWWKQQSLPQSAGKPDTGAPPAAVPPKHPSALRTWAKVLGTTILVLLTGMAVLVVVVLQNKDSVTTQPDSKDAHLPVDENTAAGQQQDASRSVALDTPSKPPPQPSHEEAMQRILGNDLHPDPPAIATQPLEPPHLEPPPTDPVKPPEEKKPPVTEKPPEEKKPPVTTPEKPPVTAPNADALFEKRLARRESDLREELAKVPELRVVTDLEVKTFREGQAVAGLARRTPLSAYAFSTQLHQAMLQKGLKAGLPLRTGAAARLDVPTALAVQTVSKELRAMGFVSIPGAPAQIRLATGGIRTIGATTLAGGSPQAKIDAFKKWCDENRVEKYTGALATLLQMLQVEDKELRLLLVREMGKSKVQGTSVVLASRALTDPSPKVRQAAVAALKKRPAAQYQRILLRGFSYPWPPIADHAAQALVTLELKDAVPQLVKLLDQADPAVPVLNPKTHKYTVRQLVRLNHMRNCFLCHPPAVSAADGLVHGTVPTIGKPLPPAYYAEQNGDAVRADTTFLRQDFSLCMPVKDAAPWPDEQRFDFLVRQRVVPLDKETEARPPASFPQREAVTYTLRKLTGKDGGDSRQKWEEMLGITTDDKGSKAAEKKKLTPEMARLEEKAAPYLRFARKLIDDGMVEKARQRLAEIVKEYPGTPSADQAKRLLHSLQDKE